MTDDLVEELSGKIFDLHGEIQLLKGAIVHLFHVWDEGQEGHYKPTLAQFSRIMVLHNVDIPIIMPDTKEA